MGKYAQQHYEGPQLDFSAFSDLVNHHQYKSVLQLSPAASASRSEDSYSTASSHQGSPRPPAKRSLTLQSVQEDQIETDQTEGAAVTGSPQEQDTGLEVQTRLSNEAFVNRNNNHELNFCRQVEDLDKLQRKNETGEVFSGQNLDSGDFIVKPPSPFAEDNVHNHANTSSPIYENQSPYLPTTSANQEYLYGHTRQPSGDSVGYSSAHGSCYSAESKTPSQSEFLHSPQHVRDNSYDSLLSEDRTASLLNEDKNNRLHEESRRGFQEDGVEIIPVRYGIEDSRTNMDATEGKTNANIRYSATFDAVYDQDNRLNSSGMDFCVFLFSET